MGTSVLGNPDSQVWKMLGLDEEDTTDKIKNTNGKTEKNNLEENGINTEKERLKRD
ncbi:hypothetical protein [Aminipila terrae]|uniref:Uncharacterized protein n=1 Tax=Aminipila terrae TaxID=2697030 RepID=A0A6P1MKA8_9FIRM|nr:hypothetical protein [Aminipila terrae]QHI72066.1 hypothetical protein Ami3637_06345 [Aminipila terrae]